MPPPTNVSDVRSFLGMVNQLAKFAGDLAQQSAPIRDLLRKDRVSSWDVVHQMAFDRIKKTVVSAPVLRSDTRVRRQLIPSFRRRTTTKTARRHMATRLLRLAVAHRRRTTLCTDRKGVLSADVGVRTAVRLYRRNSVSTSH
jgi:hypothetical protein